MFMGVISFLITLGTSPSHLNLIIDFLVIKVPAGYNVILRRPCMRMAKAVMSTYHLVMKFHTEEGIKEVRGNQLIARECYFATMKGKQKAK